MTYYKITYGTQTPRIFVFPDKSVWGRSFFKSGLPGACNWQKKEMGHGFAKKITKKQAQRFLGEHWHIVEKTLLTS
jgi:hypothetical protein